MAGIYVGGAKLAYKYEVDNLLKSGETIKRLNGIDLVGSGDAELTKVMFADNLYSSSSQSNSGTFLIRTSGGNSSIATGKSKLLRMLGNIEIGDTMKFVEPTSFVSVGFNLYDNSVGYARIVGGQRYNVTGSHTKLEWAETIDGQKHEIYLYPYEINGVTTNNATYELSTGYLFVTGGDDTTMVNLIWSGTRLDAEYEEYKSSTINIPTQGLNNDTGMVETLPTELRAVGDCRDELSFDLMTWTVNVGRTANTPENFSSLMAAHPDWEWLKDFVTDSEYIYYKKSKPTIYTLSNVSGVYDVDDFGIEIINSNTNVEPTCYFLYGENLKDKLRVDVLTKTPQQLTQSEQEQVRTNLNLHHIYLHNLLITGTNSDTMVSTQFSAFFPDPITSAQSAVDILNVWIGENSDGSGLFANGIYRVGGLDHRQILLIRGQAAGTTSLKLFVINSSGSTSEQTLNTSDIATVVDKVMLIS